MNDTPSLGRHWCPGCEPLADPRFEILDTRWCVVHVSIPEAPDDRRVDALGYLVGSTEAGGQDNRWWCDLLHRGKRA